MLAAVLGERSPGRKSRHYKMIFSGEDDDVFIARLKFKAGSNNSLSDHFEKTPPNG